jgi:hypothetical protein
MVVLQAAGSRCTKAADERREVRMDGEKKKDEADDTEGHMPSSRKVGRC